MWSIKWKGTLNQNQNIVYRLRNFKILLIPESEKSIKTWKYSDGSQTKGIFNKSECFEFLAFVVWIKKIKEISKLISRKWESGVRVVQWSLHSLPVRTSWVGINFGSHNVQTDCTLTLSEVTLYLLKRKLPHKVGLCILLAIIRGLWTIQPMAWLKRV